MHIQGVTQGCEMRAYTEPVLARDQASYVGTNTFQEAFLIFSVTEMFRTHALQLFNCLFGNYTESCLIYGGLGQVYRGGNYQTWLLDHQVLH